MRTPSNTFFPTHHASLLSGYQNGHGKEITGDVSAYYKAVASNKYGYN
jgi:hypothetical protein